MNTISHDIAKISVKQAIEQVAQEYLAPLDENNHPMQIQWKVQKFRDTIFNSDIIDECNDFDNIMHTETVPMKLDHFHQTQDMAWWSAYIFDATFFYVSEKNDELSNSNAVKTVSSPSGVIFLGFEKRVDAAKILYSYLFNIALNVRNAYIASLKRFKKQSSKDERADEYMEEWYNILLNRDWRDGEWYDTSYANEFLKYTKKHFVTFDEKCKIAVQAAKILKPFLDNSLREKLRDRSVTWESLKKEYLDQIPFDKVDRIFKRLDKIKKQETIISFPYQDWVEKQRNSDKLF